MSDSVFNFSISCTRFLEFMKSFAKAYSQMSFGIDWLLLLRFFSTGYGDPLSLNG